MLKTSLLTAALALTGLTMGCNNDGGAESTGDRGNPSRLDPNQGGGRPINSGGANTSAGGVGGTGTGVTGTTGR